MPRLTATQKQDARVLAGQGHRLETIAELFEVSPTTVQRVVESPPSDEELTAARGSLSFLRAARSEDEPTFAGWMGDAALWMAELCGCPADGGDGVALADGTPRP